MLFAAGLCSLCAAADFYDTVNSLRAGQGACAVEQPRAPLMRQQALDRAAQGLAAGQTLQDSVKGSGYRASTSLYINISGDDIDRNAAALLSKQYCAQLLRVAIADIGIYQDARQLWIVLAAPFAPQVALSAQDTAKRVLDLVNQARGEARLCGDKPFKAAGPLRWNAVLAEVSLRHSADMAHYSYFSHTARDGSTPSARVERGGYRYRATGENIAAGQTTPEAAVAGWIKSPPHCANIMNAVFTEMGVAYAVDNSSELGVYWTQVLGTPR